TEAKYFLQRGWTRIRRAHLSGKSLCTTRCSQNAFAPRRASRPFASPHSKRQRFLREEHLRAPLSAPDTAPSVTTHLSINQPQDHAHRDADDERCHQREVEGKIRTLDNDVAGQPSESQPVDPWPKQSGSDQNEPDDNECA